MVEPSPTPDPPTTSASAEPAGESLPGVAALSRTDGELWLETCVVLLLGVAGPLISSLYWAIWPELYVSASFTQDAAFLLVYLVQIAVLVLYLISRSGEPWSTFGFVPLRWWADFFTVLGLLFVDYLLYYLLWFKGEQLLGRQFTDFMDIRFLPPFPRPTRPGEYVLLVVLCSVIGFSEELVMRGYLLPRFEHLLGSTTKALVVTSFLFASYHLYQGPSGVFSALIGGFVYGGAFCWLRRLWPVAVGHAVFDVIAYLTP